MSATAGCGPRAHDDRGVYAILYALLVVVVVMTAAIVVDLSGMREDRRSEKLAADAAATAGAIKLNTLAGTANANEACLEAWRFLKVNLSGAVGATANCPTSDFPTTFATCPTSARTATGDAGPWSVTITWPVPNGHTLMTDPNVTGRSGFTQPYDPDVDGTDPCQRLGVTVERDRDFVFASVGGFVDGTTINSSVARAELKGTVSQEFPLVVLDQSGCNVLTAGGSDPQQNTIKVLNNGITPGRLAIDSAANQGGGGPNSCTMGNRYPADAGGGGRILALNGSSGAPGQILAYAKPVSKAADPSDLCATGTNPALAGPGICPRPISYQQITRKYWDWQFHCTLSTTAPLSAPCPYTDTVPDYIGGIRDSYAATKNAATNFNAAAAAAAGWTVITDCNSNTPYRYFPPGNYYVNCNTFSVNKTTVFGGGVVVFSGNVVASGNGGGPYCLVFNQPVGLTPTLNGSGLYDFCSPTSAASVSPAPLDPMLVFLQNGTLSRQNSDFIAPETTIYQEADPAFGGSPSTRIDLGAGTSAGSNISGTLLLTGPTEGVFRNLSVWSENTATSSSPNRMGAQSKLALEGILFLPKGQVEFGGNPTYLGQARAQFIAWRLAVSGGGTLTLFPDAERTLTIPVGGVRLIR